MTYQNKSWMLNLRTAAILMTIVLGLFACDNNPTNQSAAITTQPTDQNVVVGTTATFNMVASNATGYQWQSSTDSGTTFVDVSGATGASYSTAATSLGDSGTQYRVVVTGASNSVTSSAVTLTVTSVAATPAITVQPAYTSVTSPAMASFSVTATGTNLNYQWQQCMDSNETCASWSDLSGAIAATYTTGATDVSMTGQRFRVVISNTEGSLDSAVATLNVNPTPVAPVITSQPVDAAVVAPATASFTVAFTSVPTVLPLWQYSNNGTDWFNLGILDNTYTTDPTSTGDNGRQFRAILENAAGSVTTNVVTLTVAAASAPGFTTQPANVTITEGQNAQFTVVVTGTPTPTLQWQVSTDSGSNWSNINGETGTIFNAAAVALANNGRQFRAVATNGSGSVNSDAAVLTVTAAQGKTFGTAAIAASGTGIPGCLFGMATNGNAITLWVELYNASNLVLKANHYSAQNNTWDSGQIISASSGDVLVENPQLAMNANGNAVAVWEQSTATVPRKDIWASYYTAGVGWGSATLLETDNTAGASAPQIVIDASGNATAVWAQFDGTYNSIMTNRYAAGASWSTASAIATGSGNRYSPQIAIAINGNAFATWSSYYGPGNSLIASLYSGSWSPPVEIGSDTLNFSISHNARIAFDSSGNAIAVWAEATGMGFGATSNIKANRYDAGTGTWGTPALIEWNGGEANSPKIAIDINGDAIAVWAQSDGSLNRIWVNRYTASSSTWGGFPANIQSDGNGGSGSTAASSNPDIAFDSSGNALVVWSQQPSGTPADIWVNQYTTGSGWGTVANHGMARINVTGDNLAQGASHPHIAFDVNNNAMAVWTQDDTTGPRLRFNLYQ